MAIRKPTPKPAPKQKPALKPRPTPKPTPKPAPIPQERLLRPTPTPTPKPAPLDLVRNPNFDSAMAQQNYQNSLAEQRARIDGERGQFTQGRLNGAPLTQSEIDKKYVDDGRGGRVLNAEDAAKLALQFDQLRANNKSMGGARDYGIDYIEGGQRYAPVNQGPQVGGGMGGQGNFPAYVDQSQFIDPQSPQGQAMEKMSQMARDALSRYNPNAPSLMPIQTPGSGALNQDLANRGMGGLAPQQPGRLIPLPGFERQEAQQMKDYQKFLKQGMQNSNTLNQGGMTAYNTPPEPALIPQGQQMQNYQNFLKQGMQNSNTLNQGAMAGFANMQPGMQVPQVPQAGVQVPQPGIGQTQGPNMAGMATQKRRQNPAQRKFSTFSNKPARFF